MSRRSGNCGRCCLVVFAVVSALCVSGPAIYWKFKKSLSLKTASLNSCSPCICDCAPPPSLLKIAPEMVMPMTCSNGSMFPPSPYSLPMIATDNLEYGLGNIGSPLNSVAWINLVLKRFGSNIIFSNGMQDPWSRGGVLKNISSSIVALETEKGAHHVDFRSATNKDPEWLIDQRRQEVEIIQKWLQEY